LGKRQGALPLILPGLLGLARNHGYLGQEELSFCYRQLAIKASLDSLSAGFLQKMPDELLLATSLNESDSNIFLTQLFRISEVAEDFNTRGEALLLLSRYDSCRSAGHLRESFRHFQRVGNLARALAAAKSLIESLLISECWPQVSDAIRVAVRVAEQIELPQEVAELQGIARRWKYVWALREGDPLRN
jgi:hypothetical protein